MSPRWHYSAGYKALLSSRFVPFSTCLNAHNHLLLSSAPERFPLEASKLCCHLETLRTYQQVQFLREEAAHVEVLHAEVLLLAVCTPPGEIPAHLADLRCVVVDDGLLHGYRAPSVWVFVITLVCSKRILASQDRNPRVEHIEDKPAARRELAPHVAKQRGDRRPVVQKLHGVECHKDEREFLLELKIPAIALNEWNRDSRGPGFCARAG